MKKPIAMLLLLIPLSSPADCQQFRETAYRLQMDRQNNIYHEPDHSTLMMSDMHNNIWQRPRFREQSRKESAARRFANDWFNACDKGWYK